MRSYYFSVLIGVLVHTGRTCHSGHYIAYIKQIGCYAQTEIGHGSNVRALETTATFVHESDGGGKGGSWRIHSPTLTSTKFWPGTLGRVGNHAMVIARLIDGQKVDRGIHNFLVQIRSMDDHSLMPGVITGDIGPKLGYNNMDNGFARFNNILIPRRNMAMKFASVDSNGNYSKKQISPAASKIAFVTMMQVRAIIIEGVGKLLGMACTISIRYSAVRRQGFDEKSQDGKLGKTEVQIIDYKQQQHRLLPLLASSCCFYFIGKKAMADLNHMEQCINQDTGSITKTRVADIHVLTNLLYHCRPATTYTKRRSQSAGVCCHCLPPMEVLRPKLLFLFKFTRYLGSEYSNSKM